jgi:hypothetical protein
MWKKFVQNISEKYLYLNWGYFHALYKIVFQISCYRKHIFYMRASTWKFFNTLAYGKTRDIFEVEHHSGSSFSEGRKPEQHSRTLFLLASM